MTRELLKELVYAIEGFARDSGGELPHRLNLAYSVAANHLRSQERYPLVADVAADIQTVREAFTRVVQAEDGPVIKVGVHCEDAEAALQRLAVLAAATEEALNIKYKEALNLALMHLEDKRAIASVRKALDD